MFTMDCNIDVSPADILIVDDEPSSVLELSQSLKDLGQIHTASTGQQALQLARELMPDVMVLDIQLPDMTGFDVCEAIRSNDETKTISIIFITAYDQLDNEIASLSQGGIDFISKPFDHRVCQLRVRNLILIRSQAKKLDTAKQELQQLVNQVPTFISYWDADWNNLFCNDSQGSWFGLNQKDLDGQPLSLIIPQTIIREMQNCQPDSGGYFHLNCAFEVISGETRHFIMEWSQLAFHNQKNGYLLTLTEITHQKQIEHNLHHQKEQLNVLLNSITEGVIATDQTGMVSYLNHTAERMTGWKYEEALYHPIEDIMELRDPETKVNAENPIRICLRQQRVNTMPLNIQLISRDGRISDIEETAAPLRNHDGKISGSVSVIHDISHSVSLSLLRHQTASFDQLTNVPNRLFIREKLQLACDAVRVGQMSMALAVIDIDHFKFFNDSHGNGTGDKVLRVFAGRLFENFEPEHSVGRLGADEFMVILRGFESQQQLESDLHTLLDLCRMPISLSEGSYSLAVSIGVSMITQQVHEPDRVLQQADAALYRAKFEGGDRYRVFTDELERSLLQRRSTEELLRNALIHKQLIEVYYQPKVDLASGRPIGVEALVRIRDHQGKLIAPLEFIPIAEESGLILQLGNIVLLKACEDCVSWINSGCDIPVSINISAVQCLNDNFVENIQHAIHMTGITPEMLELEVTETAFIRNFEETLDKFTLLAEMGIQLSIDDFGKGYSNLTYLRRLNVDRLKLDMSYVRGMLTNQRDYEIVKTIINLGLSMDLELIAEGIETEALRKELLKLGCRYGQGYLYSKPLPYDQFIDYLHSHIEMHCED